MKIESVDFFYLSMPEVTTAEDGSQDALLVRVSLGGQIGWGECESSPLTSISAFVTPMSHGVCRPVGASVLGETVDGPEDIARISRNVARYSMDLLQAPHTWSGVEMAIWDALGRALGEPVWRLLGYYKSYPKTPYASVLFSDDPQTTLDRARTIRTDGFKAAKFGWGPFGSSLSEDIAQLDAAREGLGPDGILLIDTGQVFGEDVERAAQRLVAMERNEVTFFEEPFHGSAYSAYAALQAQSSKVKIAGGEAAHSRYMAEHLIDYGRVRYVQIDCGRIGGIGTAKMVADYAVTRGVTYINHTFTSNLALSASLQPYAGLEHHGICEYPTGLKDVARDLTINKMLRNSDGQIEVPDAPGLGMEVNLETVNRYLQDVEILVGGRKIFSSTSP